MAFKQLSWKLEDIDEKKGIVKAIANAYNFEDSDGDISIPGSFDKTVKENFKRIRVLKDHNPRQMVGVPLELDASNPIGLMTITQFNMRKELAKDMFYDIELMHENGLNAELSIGYEVIKRDQKDKRKVKEYALYEYSFLSSWGANKLSTVQDIKSFKQVPGILELIQKSYDLPYSDTRLRQIEKLLIKIDTSDDFEPSADTLDLEPLSNLINNLKF